MRKLTTTLSLLVVFSAGILASAAQRNSQVEEQSVAPSGQESGSIALMADRIVKREHELIKQLRKFSPRAETYLQEFKPDPELGPVISGDKYDIGRLKFDRAVQEAT